MKISCLEIDKKSLDSFVAKQFNSQLLQSSIWSDFQEATNKNCWHLAIKNHDQILATASVVEHDIFAGLTYLYCPRGPVVDPTLSQKEKDEVIKLLLGQLREITIKTKNRDEVFAKIEPTFVSSAIEEVCVKTSGIQPENTLLINLHQSKQQLLTSFHSKTRYNIKLASKNGLVVKKLDKEALSAVWPLFNKTSTRSNFRLHDKNYYEKMLTIPTCQLWSVEHGNNNIAVAITAYFGDTITYLHGASDYQYRSLMAPYLLHWEIINWAKENNFRWYDLHGIAPANQPQHPLNNVSRFKLGWGGITVNYPGGYDVVYSTGLYHGYKFVRKILRLLRKKK